MDNAAIIWLIFVLLVVFSIISFIYYMIRHNRVSDSSAKEQELLIQTKGSFNKKENE